MSAPAPIQQIMEVDKAWIAGFIDGEGCITIARQIRKNRPSPSYRSYITVSNTNRDSLEYLRGHYGGVLYERHEYRKDKRGKNWADAYDWYCPLRSATRLLTDILPYLRVKRQQAMLVLEFLATKKAFARNERRPSSKRGGSAPLTGDEIAHRERLRLAVKRLNSKGQYARGQIA
jgi:hypothetical protein